MEGNFEGSAVTTTREGDGKTFPKKGDILTVEYEGRLQDGNVFDASNGSPLKFAVGRGQDGNVFDASNGSPLKFAVGRGQVVAGWDTALLSVTLGEATCYPLSGEGVEIDPREVIAGWDAALMGMSLGEAVTVKIGPDMAYADKVLNDVS
ncbi:hypothetical protein T484DRAFT_1844430 [Baffinella frigidus]|nr:hypothetical protein T484DRAFT_1844430 [Cryptophyta sp. CCMP2293]